MHNELTIIPRPQVVAREHGTWTLAAESRVVWHGEAQGVAELLAEYLRPATGYALPVVTGTVMPNDIILEQTGAAEPDAAGFVDEQYTCVVSPTGVRLSASTATGLARAIQTLRQLFPVAVFAATPQAGPWTLPCVRIADRPRFRWRGMHLDVCRHFFTVEQVCRFIDLLALHRFNRLHLHLTVAKGVDDAVGASARLVRERLGCGRRAGDAPVHAVLAATKLVVPNQRHRPWRRKQVSKRAFVATRSAGRLAARQRDPVADSVLVLVAGARAVLPIQRLPGGDRSAPLVVGGAGHGAVRVDRLRDFSIVTAKRDPPERSG
jgi:hypothetical protein